MTRINPMSEMRAIAETCRRKCLPANARLLWRVLFDCANDRQKRNAATGTYDWPDGYFPVTNEELKTYSALEKRALLDARNVLKETGAIDFIPGENNRRPAMYKIHYMTAGRCRYVPAYGTAELPDRDPAALPVPGTEDDPIYKDIEGDTGKEKMDDDENDNILSSRAYARDEHEDDLEFEDEDPITDREERSITIRKSFQFFFGRAPYPAELDRLLIASWSLRMKPGMLSMALRRAASFGANSPVSYALGVLDQWRKDEVRQPHQVAQYHADYVMEEKLYGLSYNDDNEDTGMRLMERRKKQRRRENIEAGLVEPDESDLE